MADASQVAALSSNFGSDTPDPTNGTNANPSSPQSGNPIYAQILSQLNQNSGVVSSSDQTVNDAYAKAINTIQGGQDKSDTAVEAQFQQKEQVQQNKTQQGITSTEEASRGFATNTALMTQLRDEGKQSINDLEEQKTALIMSGDAAAAKSIGDLQVKQATDLLANRQKIFDNLISLAGVYNSAKQTDIQQQQVEQSKAAATAAIALKYGVEQKPGDTMQDLVNRAMPKANDEEKLSLLSTQADINAKNAQTTLYRAQAAAANDKLSSQDLSAMAQSVASKFGLPDYQTYLNSALGTLKKPTDMQAFAKELDKAQTPRDWSDTEVQGYAVALAGQGVDYPTAYQNVLNNVSIKNTTSALKTLKETYKQVDPTGGVYRSGAGFVAPGNLPTGGLGAVQPLPPASPEAQAAFQRTIKGTALGR